MIDPKQTPAARTPKEGKALQLDRQMCVVRFSPCGKVLVAGGSDATVRCWDATAEPFAPLPTLTGHNGWVQGIAFHPDGKRLFTADSWGALLCWPFAEKEPKAIWSVDKAHDGWIRGLAVSPDGQRLATCGKDGVVRLWSPDGKKLQELTGHNEDVYCVAFHPDGKSLVSGDLKGVVKQWDLTTNKPAREFDSRVLYLLSRLQDVGGVRVLAFDGKGETLAAAGSVPSVGANVQGIPTVLFFDWATGKVRETFKIGAQGDGFVYDLHHHPDGFWMGVTSGNPGVGKMFFTRPGEAQAFFVATKMANCHSLAVAPGSSRLVVSATNANSAGNGRLVGKGKDYPGNYSPLHVWDLPKA